MPMLSKYSDMKREAEMFLLTDPDCLRALSPIILRPGLVWHSSEREYSLPLKLVNDIGFAMKKILPQGTPFDMVLPKSSSINLSVLSDFAIKGALGHLPFENRVIYSNAFMNGEETK